MHISMSWNTPSNFHTARLFKRFFTTQLQSTTIHRYPFLSLLFLYAHTNYRCDNLEHELHIIRMRLISCEK
jgi:hypothetical protein